MMLKVEITLRAMIAREHKGASVILLKNFVTSHLIQNSLNKSI